jgi:hypothetical protein
MVVECTATTSPRIPEKDEVALRPNDKVKSHPVEIPKSAAAIIMAEKRRLRRKISEREWYLRHREDRLAKQREYDAKNREKRLLQMKEYRTKNKERQREYKQDWYKRNREIIKKKRRQRRETKVEPEMEASSPSSHLALLCEAAMIA